MERSCVGRGPDIKGLRGWKWARARQIEPARWQSESGHRMFESCSWDPDDRVVFGNLRARPQKWAFPPTEEWARKEGFGFQSIHSFIYITYFHRRDSFKGKRGLFSDFQFFGLCLLFPHSVSDNVFVSGATLTRGLHVRTLLTTERCIQSVGEYEESNRRLQDCFGSPVFQCGSTIRGGITKRTMGHQPWNICTMKGTLLRLQLFLDSSMCSLA